MCAHIGAPFKGFEPAEALDQKDTTLLNLRDAGAEGDILKLINLF
jgi:hypothetical protein